MKSRKFIDSVTIPVKAGKGGNGVCSFRREKFVPHGGPDGGDGGRGGNVFIKGDEDVDSLISIFFDPKMVAEDGIKGGGRKMHGRNGRDLVVPVPLGTLGTDLDTLESIADITAHGQMVRLAKGGRGGLGNARWKSSTHQAPMEHSEGTPGEERKVRLDLRIMADAGLVGFPSAGKSSLLRTITAARPKVAAYPFTTLNPIMGTLLYPDRNASLRVADIPGLIEGAHLGIGLGHHFLRHIERSKVLLYVIDMAGVDGRKPWEDYAALRKELRMHDPALVRRKSIVVANKMDLPEAEENVAKFKTKTRRVSIPFSAEKGIGVETLVEQLYKIVKPSPRISRNEMLAAATSTNAPPPKRPQPAAPRRGSVPTPPRKGYTPPKPLPYRGDNPAEGGGDISAETFKKASFLKM